MPPPPPAFLSEEDRVAHAQREWQDYLSLRRIRLKFITEKVVDESGFDKIVTGKDYATEEANVERKLLSIEAGGTKEKVQSYLESGNKLDRRFTGKDILGKGSPRDTIGLLGLLAAANVGNKFIERYFDDLTAHEGAWLFKRQFEGHKLDYPPWTREKDETSLKLQQFHTMVDALARDRDSPRLWKQLNAMFRLNGYLIKILRFVDENNPYLGGRPALPDGSNIEEAPLKASWVLHRTWIRLLHYRSLSIGSQARGIDQLKNILVIARAQLEQEFRDAPPSSRKTLEGLLEFETILETLTLLLKTLAVEFGKESIPKPGARVPYSVQDFNIDADRVGAFWAQVCIVVNSS